MPERQRDQEEDDEGDEEREDPHGTPVEVGSVW
jgi:hypothetical protein